MKQGSCQKITFQEEWNGQEIVVYIMLNVYGAMNYIDKNLPFHFWNFMDVCIMYLRWLLTSKRSLHGSASSSKRRRG